MSDFNELKQDVKEIKSKVEDISATLLRNTVSLELHERRTSLAEARLDKYEANSKWVIGLIASGVIAILLKLLFPA